MKRLLDACCGLGGATKGYQRAGFRVTGIDIIAQPDYCGDEFIEGDALNYLADVDFIRRNFDAIATSFPCQASSGPTRGTNAARNSKKGVAHVDLNPRGRELLEATGLPYVMENVQGSVLRRDLILCGLMFDLRVYRHRYFELGGWSMPKRTCVPSIDHAGHRTRGWRHGVYYEGDMLAIYGKGGGKASLAEAQEGLGIDWSENYDQLKEAIPPHYTQFIGHALMAHVLAQTTAAA